MPIAMQDMPTQGLSLSPAGNQDDCVPDLCMQKLLKVGGRQAVMAPTNSGKLPEQASEAASTKFA